MADGAGLDEGLGHGVHADGRHQAHFLAAVFQGIAQGQAIDDRGRHAHVVGCGFADDRVALGKGRAAQDVAPAHHNGQFHALNGHFGHFTGDPAVFVVMDAAFARPAEAFAGELQ